VLRAIDIRTDAIRQILGVAEGEKGMGVAQRPLRPQGSRLKAPQVRFGRRSAPTSAGGRPLPPPVLLMLDWFCGYVGYDASGLTLGRVFEVDKHGEVAGRCRAGRRSRGRGNRLFRSLAGWPLRPCCSGPRPPLVPLFRDFDLDQVALPGCGAAQPPKEEAAA